MTKLIFLFYFRNFINFFDKQPDNLYKYTEQKGFCL